MNNYLQLLGIYPDAINSAISDAEWAVSLFGLNTDRLHEHAEMYLEEGGSFADITNSIIFTYFASAEYMIRDFTGSRSEYKPAFYVNCYDSHFYINNIDVVNIDDLDDLEVQK